MPLPLRVWTAACQWWPWAQVHHTRCLLPRETVSGVRGRFFSVSHSARSSSRCSRWQKSARDSRMVITSKTKKHVPQYQHIIEHARPTLGIFVAFCEIGAISRSIFCFLCVGTQRSFYLILMTSRFHAQNSVFSLRVLAKYAIMVLTKMKDNFVFRFSSNNMLILLVVYSTRRRLSSCCRQTLSGAAR